MRVRFTKSLLGDYGRAARGEVKDVADTIGKSLVARGLAETVDVKTRVGRKPPAGLGKRKAKAKAAPEQ